MFINILQIQLLNQMVGLYECLNNKNDYIEFKMVASFRILYIT